MTFIHAKFLLGNEMSVNNRRIDLDSSGFQIRLNDMSDFIGMKPICKSNTETLGERTK